MKHKNFYGRRASIKIVLLLTNETILVEVSPFDKYRKLA